MDKYTLNNKYEIYNDCVYIKWFEDENGNPKTLKQNDEAHMINNCYCILKGIPSEFYKVEIEDMIEVKNKSILEKNEYEVEYTYGLIRFNPCMNDKMIIIKEYYSRGNYYYPANRIYYSINPIDGTVVTMYDILEKIREGLRISTEQAKRMDDILKETIKNAKLEDDKLREAIELAKRLILQLGIDQYVKKVDTGNVKGKIPLNNGELNNSLNADMVDGKHADAFADKYHTHTKNQIVDLKLSYNELTDCPSSLPANGGNADMVDGKHADAFANKYHTHTTREITDFPKSLPANGGNADTVGNMSKDEFVWNSGETTITQRWNETANCICSDTKYRKNVYVEKAKFADASKNAKMIDGFSLEDLITTNLEKKDIYVSKLGNDSVNDGSKEKPFLTIQRAIKEIPHIPSASVYVHIGRGKYNENIEISAILSGHTVKLMADTNDYTQVVIAGSLKCQFLYGYIEIANLTFRPEVNCTNIVESDDGKTVVFVTYITGSNYPVITNCYYDCKNMSADYLYPIYVSTSKVRVKGVKIRNSKAKIRGAGIFSDNMSDVFCWNNDINDCTYPYYTQAATIRIYDPIIPRTPNYTELSHSELGIVVSKK